jgi:hypothetical protein
MAMPTLLDIAKAKGSDATVGLIEEAIKATPEVQFIPARTIKGMSFKTLVRTSYPNAGFRSANEGVAASVSTWENRNFACFPLNPRWECDKVIADAHEDGAPAYIAMEADGMTRAAFITMGKQLYYGVGTGGDAKGFPGLIAQHDSSMVVDAGGSTADTGSSVWAIKFGLKDVQFVYGNDGELKVNDVSEQRVTDLLGNPYTAYCQELLAWAGLQVGSIYSVGRIKKLTEDSGKGLTDNLVAELLSKFPAGTVPDALFMTRRSRLQLQKSRTATNEKGNPAPMPVESHGVPIHVTDCLLNTESLSL